MCNRVVQKDVEIRPGQRARVLMKGPGEAFEIEVEGVFSGCARTEKKGYWIKREGAVPVIIPEVTRFGEKHQITGAQSYEAVPPGTAIEGLLLPSPAGKDYRLLKVVTQDATADQLARWGNDRAPVLIPPLGPTWSRTDHQEYPPDGELVWTTDFTAVRRGRWRYPGPDRPLRDGTWEDDHGLPIVVTDWMFLEESPDLAPVPHYHLICRGGIHAFVTPCKSEAA